MSKFINKIKLLMPSKRKLIQLYAALLFNVNLKGYATGSIYQGNTKKLCMPGLNCYSCPGAVSACPLGSLQGSLSTDRSTLIYVGGIILLYCILFGRLICGWLCPFGLIQELIYKIKTPKLKKNPVTKVISYFKYFVLAFFVVIVPLIYAVWDTPLPAFCKYICPAGTLEGGILLLANKANEGQLANLGPLFTWKFVILVCIIVGSVFIFRLFCRFICPLGALYGLFNKISVFGVKVDNSKCTNCGLCVNKCKMDIKTVGDIECISCGDCINVCPTKAIKWKMPFPKNTLPETVKGNNTARRVTRVICCVLLAAILVGAAVFYWYDGPEKQSPATNQEQTYIGDNGDDITEKTELSIVTKDGISDEKVIPEATGKITVVNFWGTWCGPCVKELPYFDQIATDYKDTVSVIAVHTFIQAETAPDFINEYYPESDMVFAVDLDNAGYYTSLGGRNAYPYTAILDTEGNIVKTYATPMEYEDLKQAIEDIN